MNVIHKTMKNPNGFKNEARKWIKHTRTLLSLFALGTAQLYAQSDIIPQEIITTGEAFREFLLGDFALIVLGIIWGGACIAFGFNKDSQRGKIAFIAITVSCIALGLTQTIVAQFVSMGN